MELIARKKIFIIVAALAVSVGILYAAPQALIWLNLRAEGSPYIVMQINHHLDELVQYMPRAREVYDGHFPPSDLSLDRSYPSMFPAMPPLIFSWFIYLFSGDINLAYILVTGVFSSLIFLLVYAVSYSLTNKKLWSVFMSALAVFTVLFHGVPRVFFGWTGILNGILKKFFPLVTTLLDRHPLSRFDDPLLTAPIFLAAFLFLWLFWRDNKRKYAIAGGMFYGLLFYTYLHYWAYLAAVIGLLFLYALVKQRENRERFQNFILYVFIVFILAAPFVLNYFNFNAVPGIQDYVKRIGLEHGRLPEIGQTIGPEIFLHYALFILLGFLVMRRWYAADRSRVVFFLACLAAAFFVWNVQVITGFVPHPDHWGKPISIALFFIIGALLSDYIYKHPSRRLLSALLIIGIALLFGKAIVNSYKFIEPPQNFMAIYTFDRGIVDSWGWIDKNLPGEPEIISPSLETSYYLYSYTKARPYLPSTENTMAPNSVLEERYLTANKLFSVSEDAMIAGLRNGENYRKVFLYYLYYKKPGSDLNEIPAEKIKELRGQYSRLAPEWNAVDADYVYYGPEERKISAIDFSKDKNLLPVFENQSVQIYRVLDRARK